LKIITENNYKKINLGSSLPGDKEAPNCSKGLSQNSRWNIAGTDNICHRVLSNSMAFYQNHQNHPTSLSSAIDYIPKQPIPSASQNLPTTNSFYIQSLGTMLPLLIHIWNNLPENLQFATLIHWTHFAVNLKHTV